MGIFSGILVSMILSATDPASPAELQIAMAALKEHFTGLRSLEVTYRTHYEWKPAIKNPPSALDERSTRWIWSNGRNLFESEAISGKRVIRTKWGNNGRQTFHVNYDPESGEVRDVWTNPGVPTHARQMEVELLLTLGLSTFHRRSGLRSYLADAEKQTKQSGRRDSGMFHLDLGLHEDDGQFRSVSLILDADHDYRMVSWRIEQPDGITVLGQVLPAVWEFAVDEFQSVPQGDGNKPVWFPLRAHNATPAQIARIQVESVQLNHDVKAESFAVGDVPFGTEINEVAVLGRAPKRYLVGGEAAEEERLAKIAAAALEERDRLDREGILFDATPNSPSGTSLWMIVGGGLLIVGALSYWKQRRTA